MRSVCIQAGTSYGVIGGVVVLPVSVGTEEPLPDFEEDAEVHGGWSGRNHGNGAYRHCG